MITTEAEIRVALQAVLVTVLAFYGFWGWSLLVLAILLPWKPLFAVGGYLAQPVVDWRTRKARERHEKGIAQVEQELDAFLQTSKKAATSAESALDGKTLPPATASPWQFPRPLESFKPIPPAQSVHQEIGKTAQNLSATLEIPSAIRNHVRNLPQGVFSNMDLEVEEVKFQGDTAEASVRFQSPNVNGLVIRQRYVLRKSGDHWEVESRQPSNGASKIPPPPPSPDRLPVQLQ
jgi:hypothetical protein